MMELEDALEGLKGLAGRVAPVGGSVSRTAEALVVDHPGAKGAMSVEMMVQLAEHVLALRDAPPAVLAVKGSGPGAFCSGGHLGQVRASLVDGTAGETMARCMTAVLDGLLTLPTVVVALVDGPALGGGAELVTACDHVFVGPSARIGFVHGRLGVAPGWGGAARLVRALGARDALALLTTARVLDPAACVAAGLAEGTLEDGAARIARLRGLPEDAVRTMKRQVLAAAPLERSGAEAALFASVWGSPIHRERLG